MNWHKIRSVGFVALLSSVALSACDSDRRSPMEPGASNRVASGARYPHRISSAPLRSHDLIPGTSGLPVSGKKVLLYDADFDGAAATVREGLVATGLFAAADIADATMTASPPDLATLNSYDCVIAWTNVAPPQPAAQGDRLKEYVDAGGGVVLMTYGYSSPDDPWELQGGIMQDGYSPFKLTTNRQAFPPDRSLDFASALTSHPFLGGVKDFTYGGNNNYVEVTLDGGALLIARDNTAQPLIGVNASGNVGGINVYPGPAFTLSAGVFRTIANACISVADPGIATRQVPAGEPATLTVTEGGESVAGINIPPGTFDTDVTVTVRFVPTTNTAPCHSYLLGQIGKCLQITALDAGGNKAINQQPMAVGLCLPSDQVLELFKFEAVDDIPRALSQVKVPFLNCEGFQLGSAAPAGTLKGLAMGLAKTVGRWLSPTPLYAAHGGFGGVISIADGLSYFTWASPLQVSQAGIAVNPFHLGKDAYAMSGTFNLQQKNFAPYSTESGFSAAADPVTVSFGGNSYTIPANSFRYSTPLRRFIYASKTTSGITAMSIDGTTGAFGVAATVPTGDPLPTDPEHTLDKAFTIRIGHRTQGLLLECASTGVCTPQELR